MINLKDYKYKTKPFKHQLDALAQSACKKNFAYFMEMGCVDEDTEFLTTRGWVKFTDFDLDTWEKPLLVAQAIPQDDTMLRWGFEFTEPISYIKKPATTWYACSYIHYPYQRHGHLFMLSEGHTLPIAYQYGSKYFNKVKGSNSGHAVINYQDVPMPDATIEYIKQMIDDDPNRKPKYSKQFKQIGLPTVCSAGLLGFNSDLYEPDPELSALSEAELRFMVAVIADGTFPNKTNDKCDFYFIKERKVERLRMLAAKANIPLAYEVKKGVRKDLHVIHAIPPMRCKKFDSRWYTLPKESLKAIAEEVFYWDGYAGKDKAEFFTVEKESADFIQYALYAGGWESFISYSNVKKYYVVAAQLVRCLDPSMLPNANREIIPRYLDPRTAGVRNVLAMDVIHDVKMSYCFRVPSGYLLLRRNGRMFVSGNSGKTKVMLDNIGVLYKSGHITGALVLAPKGVYQNWSEKEIPEHLPEDIQREVLVWNAASSTGYKDKLTQQIRDWDGKKLQILVFNIESLISEKGRELIVDFIKRHDGNVFALVDESTCIKNHKAKRTKAAIEIGQKCKVRRIATGSPITNSPLDLYSQCAFLNKSLLGCGSYYAFKNTYANIEKIQNRQGQHYEKIISYKNLDKLSNLLEQFSYRITKKECLDLPEKIYTTRDVELTDAQKQVYKDMVNHQFSVLVKDNDFHEMSTQVVLTKLLRLHQVLCGTFVSDDGSCIRLENNRLTALKEVLEETSGKVIIWATYLEDIHAIENMLKEEYGEQSYVTYYGETSAEDRIKAVKLFQDESSPVRFFLGNVQTAGRGLTLTAASTVVYYSNNFSLELRQQSEDRAHRLGQKNKVTYVDLVVRGSLDEKIIKSLIEKRNIANEILKDGDLDDWISLK